MDIVKYIAVYRSETTGESAEEGFVQVCTALFGADDLDAVCAEVRELLDQGYHVRLEHGEMPSDEYDAIEDVPDDFVARLMPKEGADGPQ